MIKLTDLILEATAGDDAKRRGLRHIGWGQYADKSGKVVAKSVDGKLVDVPKGTKPNAGKGLYGKLGTFNIGTKAERKWRRLDSGDVDYDEDSGEYVARNPQGALATFNTDAMAAAFANGHKLKGYDFKNDYDNSMKKLKKELQPYLKQLKKRTTSAKQKREIKLAIKDLFTAYVHPAGGSPGGFGVRIPHSKRDGEFGGFGGGGGFSGGGAGARF
jgi:hypothetical protein